MIILGIASFVYYTVQFIFPSLLSLTYSIIAWNISKAVANLELLLKPANIDTLIRFLDTRKKLTEFVKEFENNFRILAFLLLWYDLVSLLKAFIMLMGLSKIHSFIAKTEAILILISSSVSFLSTVSYAAMIPEACIAMKRNLKELHQNTLRHDRDGEDSPLSGDKIKFLRLLKTVIDDEEFYLTAWGLVKISKSIILSALGALITYGILLHGLRIPF
ncbi:hypothetical protein NPIL_642131 [Nephila pilipes]|uniref:Gustatory receptor n=1 Tax=Nephila pilipes TaxID=299642 RepID=A0A8X6PSL0_NEPPI|nr:hypothetical protein NPIL_642131 [Nephila pilipes]